MKKLKYVLLSVLISLPLFAFSAAAANDTTPPTAPTNLAASLNGSGQVSLTWTAATDNVGVAGYLVIRNGSFVGLSSNPNFTDTTVAASTTYSYTVEAFDAANNLSPASSAVSITTTSLDTTPPTAPTNLAASLNGSGQVSLTWTAATDNVGVTGYKILRNATLIGTATGTSFLDTSVASSTTYSYTVVAFDAAGNNSVASNAVSITTPNQTGGKGENEGQNESLNGTENENETSSQGSGSETGNQGSGSETGNQNQGETNNQTGQTNMNQSDNNGNQPSDSQVSVDSQNQSGQNQSLNNTSQSQGSDSQGSHNSSASRSDHSGHSGQGD